MKIMNCEFRTIEWSRINIRCVVIPAKAGIQFYHLWIPGQARNDTNSGKWNCNV
jgi:hypothetical protein